MSKTVFLEEYQQNLSAALGMEEGNEGDEEKGRKGEGGPEEGSEGEGQSEVEEGRIGGW